ncbi:hypothetical protein [Caldimonas brevitalea]|uniref:Holin n=1 Tax=Caldimonas brevitalea TaxID=413882 RepID=A0A0G3BHN8_9BURK|nr:hypothetical protein [Caldimonas brevitalea]AKJ28852.1 hypothetical protein AAW51_2161 [Caldimonas brevitalea]
MKMIPNWRQAWRMFSVNAMVVALALQGTWAAMPDDLKGNLPAWLLQGLTVSLLVLGIAGRLVQQPKLSDESEQ